MVREPAFVLQGKVKTLHRHVQLDVDGRINGKLVQVNVFCRFIGSIFWSPSNLTGMSGTEVYKMVFQRQLGNGSSETIYMNTNPGQRTLDSKAALGVEEVR